MTNDDYRLVRDNIAKDAGRSLGFFFIGLPLGLIAFFGLLILAFSSPFKAMLIIGVLGVVYLKVWLPRKATAPTETATRNR